MLNYQWVIEQESPDGVTTTVVFDLREDDEERPTLNGRHHATHWQGGSSDHYDEDYASERSSRHSRRGRSCTGARLKETRSDSGGSRRSSKKGSMGGGHTHRRSSAASTPNSSQAQDSWGPFVSPYDLQNISLATRQRYQRYLFGSGSPAAPSLTSISAEEPSSHRPPATISIHQSTIADCPHHDSSNGSGGGQERRRAIEGSHPTLEQHNKCSGSPCNGSTNRNSPSSSASWTRGPVPASWDSGSEMASTVANPFSSSAGRSHYNKKLLKKKKQQLAAITSRDPRCGGRQYNSNTNHEEEDANAMLSSSSSPSVSNRDSSDDSEDESKWKADEAFSARVMTLASKAQRERERMEALESEEDDDRLMRGDEEELQRQRANYSTDYQRYLAQRDQHRAASSHYERANPPMPISSFYISPIHQNVAAESAAWAAGTGYEFLGHGGLATAVTTTPTATSPSPPSMPPHHRQLRRRREEAETCEEEARGGAVGPSTASIWRAKKRQRRATPSRTKECGGSLVLRPVPPPSLAPSVELLPCNRREMREDLLESFLMDAAIDGDDFCLP